MIYINVDTTQVISAFNKLEQKAEHLPMQKIGDVFMKDTDERFLKHDWPDKKDGTPATLIKTGALKEAINLKVTDTTATVDSPLEYSSYLENGTSKMPPREFISKNVDAVEDKEINDILLEHFEGF